MKKIIIIGLCLFTINLFSQNFNQNAEYWNTWIYKPKAEMVNQFEKAAGLKTKKFNTTKENTIVTFKVVTGKNSGQYLRVMPWQSSADYDKDKTKELNYWKENVSKFVDPLGGAQRWVRMKWGDMNIVEGQSPSKYLVQTDYIVKPSKWDDFRRWLERIGKIYGERIPEHKRIIVSLVSGGNWNQTNSFIGFDKYSRTPQKFDNTWEKDYNEKFGANSFDTDRRAYNESIEMIVGQQVQTLELVASMLPN
jgi:hypothetical protein